MPERHSAAFTEARRRVAECVPGPPGPPGTAFTSSARWLGSEPVSRSANRELFSSTGQLQSRRGPSSRDKRLATHDFNGRRLSAAAAARRLAAPVAGSFAREGRRKVASGKAPSEPAIVTALSACSCGRIVEIDRRRSCGHDWSCSVSGSAQGAVRVAPWIFMSNESMRVLCHCRCRCRIFCS